MTQPTTEQCVHNCNYRIISHTPGLWECLKCHQLWDRSENGRRVWDRQQQAVHRTLWSQALRSEKYPQGREYLRIADPTSGAHAYTSTGVAVDTCPFTSWSKGPGNAHAALSGDDTPSFLIPTITVMNWLGLSSPQGHFDSLPQHPHLQGQKVYQNTLIYLADRLGVDFPTTADIIESNPPGMFL